MKFDIKVGSKVAVTKGKFSGKEAVVTAVDKKTKRIVPEMGPFTVIAGTSSSGALERPFYQVVPLLFLETIERYIQQQEERIGEMKRKIPYSIIAEEIMGRAYRLQKLMGGSISLYLTRLMLQEPEMRRALDYPAVRELNQRRLDLLKHNPRYSEVAGAYDYLEANGLAHVVDLLRRDPELYLQQVQ